jgi:membrane associated rhomboid family serine protease
MFLPIRTDSPLRVTPYMNWALILLNVAAFACQKAVPGFEANLRLYPQDPSLAAFFGYQFLHGDVWHLVSNMLFLYIFGNNINDKIGHIGYLAFYLAGGVVAGVGYTLMEHGVVPMVGASGAVAAVTGAYLVLLPYSTVTVFYMLFFVGTLELPGFVFVLLFFLKDLIGFSGNAGGIAYAAHVAGTAFGFIVCMILLAVHLLPRDQFDVLAVLSRWNKRRQYRDMVSKGYNPFDYGSSQRAGGGGAPVHIQQIMDPKAAEALDLRAEIAEAHARHDLGGVAERYVRLREIDPTQVLPRQQQFDVANHLAGTQRFPEAADAYEAFLTAYPKFEQVEQVELMLGLIYARYLSQYALAREHLQKAMARLHGDRELEMARSELSRIEPLLNAPAT